MGERQLPSHGTQHNTPPPTRAHTLAHGQPIILSLGVCVKGGVHFPLVLPGEAHLVTGMLPYGCDDAAL